MPKLLEVAKINGKTVYKDVNGNLCTDTDGFLYLRALTEKERDELRRSAKGAIDDIGDFSQLSHKHVSTSRSSDPTGP